MLLPMLAHRKFSVCCWALLHCLRHIHQPFESVTNGKQKCPIILSNFIEKIPADGNLINLCVTDQPLYSVQHQIIAMENSEHVVRLNLATKIDMRGCWTCIAIRQGLKKRLDIKSRICTPDIVYDRGRYDIYISLLVN